MDDFIYQVKLKQIEDCDKEARHIEISKQDVNTNIIKLQQQISALEALKGYLK